ncbi:MAG: class B sortase [Ruminiclostridium sp.]|nr:class B sortase [Ruminiclostridium sp.]
MPDYKSVMVSTKKKKKKKQNPFLAFLQGLIPWKGDSVGEIIRKIVFLVSIIALCVAVVIIADTYIFKPVRDKVEYDSNILELYNKEPTKEDIEALPEKAINVEYATFYGENSDFVGWITIKDTNINYPVVQGKDNDEYLYADFRGNYNKNGTIFADYENRFKSNGDMSANTILYGHNLRTENYFTDVTEYRRIDLNKSLDFLKAHPVIEFNTLFEKAKYKIFSVMILNTTEDYGDVFRYTQMLDFPSKTAFNNFAAECLDRSDFFTGVDIKYGDEFLTLSTCEFESMLYDMRIVVVARKVRDGESSHFTEEELDKFVRNPDPKYCEVYRDNWFYGTPWSGRYWDPAWIEGYEKDDTFLPWPEE